MAGTLGERLRAINEQSAAAARAAELARLREEDAKVKAECAAIEDFFAKAIQSVELAISAGRKVPLITLGKQGDGTNEAARALSESSWNDSRNRVDNPRHKYHGLWATFAAWAANEQLKVEWQYAHDGVGMYSWHVLTVAPL